MYTQKIALPTPLSYLQVCIASSVQLRKDHMLHLNLTPEVLKPAPKHPLYNNLTYFDTATGAGLEYGVGSCISDQRRGKQALNIKKNLYRLCTPTLWYWLLCTHTPDHIRPIIPPDSVNLCLLGMLA